MPTRTAKTTNIEELPLRRFLTYRLGRLQARLNTQATKYLAHHAGITLSEWRVIALIGNAGETTATEVSREGLVDKGLLSRTVKALVRRGLLETRQDDNDHRVHRLRLSGKGRALFERTLPLMRARQRYLYSSMTPAEIDHLMSAIDKLEIAAEATEFPK